MILFGAGFQVRIQGVAALVDPRLHLALGENGYRPGASAVAGAELAADIEADKPFSVSFDPASLLAL